MDEILSFTDSSFKYFLLAFNLMSLIVVVMIKRKIRIKKQHHVLFVIAHPDDEVMFFRPTIRSIGKDYFIHVLCLSSQNQLRKQQFDSSMKNLSIYKYQCLQKKNLKDGENWYSAEVRQEVLHYVNDNSIKAIFTFDDYGVSGHKNHKSVNQSLKFLQLQKTVINKLHAKGSKNDESLVSLLNSSIKIYYLNSVNIARKYTGILQVFIGLLRDYSWIDLNIVDAFRSLSLHKSQFVWFRKLWIVFSQYNYLNVYSLSRIRICKQNLVQKYTQSQIKMINNTQKEKNQ